jgi:hypothetical protein
MYARARRIGYSGFPNVDVSREQEQRRRREEEDGILAGRITRQSIGDDNSATPARRGERRSAKNQRAGLGKGKDNGNGNVKGKARMGVYGAWADRVTSVERPLVAADVDDAPFDGENENPGAWRTTVDGGATQLTWTRNRMSAPRPPVAPRAFVLEDTPEPEDAAPASVVERSDAVDLVSHEQVVEATRPRTKSDRREEAREARVKARTGGTPPQRLEPAVDQLVEAPPPPAAVYSPPSPVAAPRGTSPARGGCAPSSFRVPSYARWSQPDDENPWA